MYAVEDVKYRDRHKVMREKVGEKDLRSMQSNTEDEMKICSK